MINLDEGQEPTRSEPQRASGCIDQVLFSIGLIGVILLIALAQSTTWSMDELIIDETLRTTWFSRALPAAGFLFALLIPLAILGITWKPIQTQAAFRTWALASLFGLILLPARLLKIYEMQGADILQLGLVGLYCGLIFLLQKRWNPGEDNRAQKKVNSNLLLVLGAGVITGIPWLAWGALGSPLDTFITFVSGLAFGLAAGMTLWLSLFKPVIDSNPTGEVPYIRTALASVAALGIFTFGIQHTGLEWYLLYCLPVLGFALTALALYGKSGWLPLALLVGLVAAFPMMLIDPDEVSLVINSGNGEVISWVTQAGDVSLLLIAVLGIVLYFLRKRMEPRPATRMVSISAIIPWFVAALTFIIAGRPGFYGERLFVILKDQADVSQAAGMRDYNARRQFVYSKLVEQAITSQVRLRKTLDQFGIRYTPYYLVNGLEVQGGPIVRAWLAAQPEVGRILNNPILRPLPANPPVARGDAAAPNGIQWNQSMLEADRVWNELHIDGKGIVVGQSDSGVQGDHPDLQSTYRGTVAGNDYNWLDPWNHTQKPTDIGGHGTHTLGIILGKKTGIAPGATWIGCVNLARNLGNPSVYLNCMQFMLAPYPQNGDPFRDGDPTQSAMVLNNSWGCPDIEGCDPESLAAAVNALKAAGIFVVASAGNSGDAGCGSVQDPPAIYASAYSVGAIDEKGNLASFSSLGPVSVDGSNRVKPDILAPGVDVLSTFPGNTYQVESGTSMAGPHIVGVVALIWSANPTLIGDIDRTTSILDQSTKAYKGQYPACVNSAAKPNDAAGWGVVDAYQAVKLALQEK